MLINYQDCQFFIEKKPIKHAYLRIKNDGGVVMTVNKKLREDAIHSIIVKQYPKLKPKIDEIKFQQNLITNVQNVAYYLGEKFEVVISYKQKEKGITIINNQLVISCVDDKILTTDEINLLLNKWYHHEAAKVFNLRLDSWYDKILQWNVLKPSLTIKAMKARFGSYNQVKHRVTLNLWLIKAPINLIDYVLAHEFSHIKHFNHSKHFYDELVKLYPNWKDAKKNLNDIARFYCNNRSFL